MPNDRIIKHADTMLYLYYQNGSVYEDCGYDSRYYKAAGEPRKLCILPVQLYFGVFMMEVVRYMEGAKSGKDYEFSCDVDGFPVMPNMPLNKRRDCLLRRLGDSNLCNKANTNGVRHGETCCYLYCTGKDASYTIHDEESRFYDYAVLLSSVFRFANRYTEDTHNKALALLCAINYDFAGSQFQFALENIKHLRKENPQEALERIEKMRKQISIIQDIFDANTSMNGNITFPNALLPKLTVLDDVLTDKPQTLLHVLSDYAEDGLLDTELHIGLVHEMAVDTLDHKGRRAYLPRLDAALNQIKAFLDKEINGDPQGDKAWDNLVNTARGQLVPRSWFSRIIHCA